jgi:flagellar L-ring protein precursor FlgH
MRTRFALFAALSLAAAWATPSSAQNSRLFDRPLPIPIRLTGGAAMQNGAGMQSGAGEPGVMYGPTIDNASWITVPLPPPRELRVHDMVTVRIDISQRAMQDGNLQRRKNATLNAQLRDWVVLEGLTQMKAAPQTDGDEKAQGTLNKQDRVSSQLSTSESLKVEVGAEVVAILPNGNVVLGANRQVVQNEETWLVSISGVCSKDAIGPGNLILSKDIADLNIRKTEWGAIKDSYRRGWLQRAWDLVKLF